MKHFCQILHFHSIKNIITCKYFLLFFIYILFLKLISLDSFRNIKYNLCAFYNSYIDDFKRYFK